MMCSKGSIKSSFWFILFVCLTIVFMILGFGGCSYMRGMHIASPVPRRQVVWRAYNLYDDANLIMDLELKRNALANLPTYAQQTKVFREPLLIDYGVVRQVSEFCNAWDSYVTEMNSAGLLPYDKADTCSSSYYITDNFSEPTEVQEIRRKYSAAYFNARLRVELLQSRIANSDESYRAVLVEKLQNAQIALDTVDRTCRAEINEVLDHQDMDWVDVVPDEKLSFRLTRSVSQVETVPFCFHGDCQRGAETFICSDYIPSCVEPRMEALAPYDDVAQTKRCATCETIERFLSTIGHTDYK